MKIIDSAGGDNLTKSEKQSLGILFFVLVLAISYIFGNRVESYVEEVSPEEIAIMLSQMTDNRLDDFFTSLDLKASSVLIVNADSGQKIYGKDVEKVMPLASIVKVMTAIVAIENIEEFETITIPKEALRLVGDNGLLVNEKWGRDELLRFTLVTSSNDATRAISMHIGQKIGAQTEEDSVKIFVDLMNQKAKDLGLINTFFLNESGLDMPDGKNGGYGNAEEVSRLFKYAIQKYPDIFAPTSLMSQIFESRSGVSHTAINTNPNVGKVLGISASKTGFTNISGGNLIISFVSPLNETILVSVLGSTFADRFTDIERLSSTTLKIINEVQL